LVCWKPYNCYKTFVVRFLGIGITYAIALFASAAILWFFGRFDGIAPIICLSETVVLGFTATLGASAGRLLLQ